jgi:hypothetical protein
MTVQELILKLDHARDDATVFVGIGIDGEDTHSIIDIQKDENGNVVLVIEGEDD